MTRHLIGFLVLAVAVITGCGRKPSTPPTTRPTTRPAPKEALAEIENLAPVRALFKLPDDLENFLVALGISRDRPSFTNAYLPIWLQSRQGESGVSYNSFLDIVSEASTKAYSETKGHTDVVGMQNLLLFSAANGHKARSLVALTPENGKVQSWRLFVLDVHVSAFEATDAICLEIKRRFRLDPPFVLKLWIDSGDVVYVDVVAP